MTFFTYLLNLKILNTNILLLFLFFEQLINVSMYLLILCIHVFIYNIYSRIIVLRKYAVE